MSKTRIRTIKPEFYQHEGLFDAEATSQLPIRLAFAGLLACCDREGRFKWQPRRLKLNTIPYDPVDMNRVLEVLGYFGFINQYTVEGHSFGYLPTFTQHQVINHRESASTLPDVETGRVKRFVIYFSEKQCPHCKHKTVDIDTQDTSVPSSSSRDEHTDPMIHYSHHNQPFEPATFTISANKPGFYHAVSFDYGYTLPTHYDTTGKSVIREKDSLALAEQKTARSQLQQNKTNTKALYDTVRDACLHNTRAQPVHALFNYWCETMNHPKAHLDDKRRRIITQALNWGYSVEELCQAIQGCAKTPFNMGDNERGQRYDGLQLILRSADQIDRFIQNNQSPPQTKGDSTRHHEHHHRQLMAWSEKRMHELAQDEANTETVLESPSDGLLTRHLDESSVNCSSSKTET